MRKCKFRWLCDCVFGTLELSLTEKEVDLIKAAYRDSFSLLEDRSELSEIRERAVNRLNFYDPNADQDIRIYFPDEIKNEVDNE